MRKRPFSLLLSFFLLAGLFVMPRPTFAGDCTQPVEDVADYTVEITTSINFRSSIQGGEADECPESLVIGSLAQGQVVWVLGEIETGVPVEEGSDEYLSWLYIQHPITKDFGFVWGKHATPIQVPQEEQGHQEVVIEPGSVTGTGQPAEEVPIEDEECEVIDEVEDYFVQVTDSLNVRDGVCFGEVINSLDPEQEVKVIGKLNDWLYILHPDGSKGFIHSDYVEQIDTPEDHVEDAEVLVGNDRAVYREAPEAEADEESTGDEAESEAQTLLDIVGHEYETAIRYLEGKNIVEGYPDGFYKAKLPVNRAEFTKIVVGAQLGNEPFSSADTCFPDVMEEAWYSSYVCYAKQANIIGGYPDGTFKPGNSINLVEAAKILVNTFEIQKAPEGDQWYEAYVGGMENRNYIPASFNALDQFVDRGQMAEMMWRILNDVTNKTSKNFGFAGEGASDTSEPAVPADGYVNACYDDDLPSNIDTAKVREQWLAWHNATRAEHAADPLTLHEALIYSANESAQENASTGMISHIPSGQWFTDLGISFQLLSGYVYAENVARGAYTCDEADCTDELLAELEKIYAKFTESTEDVEPGDYFSNIIEPDFRQMGLGLAIDDQTDHVYVTVHFAQAVESYPDVCQ